MHSNHEHGCVKSDLIKIHVTNGLRSGKMYPDMSNANAVISTKEYALNTTGDDDVQDHTNFEMKHNSTNDNDDIYIDIDYDVTPIVLPVVHQYDKSTQTESTTRSIETQTNHSCVYKCSNASIHSHASYTHVQQSILMHKLFLCAHALILPLLCVC